MDAQIQTKLVSRLNELILPEYDFSLPLSTGNGELNDLVNKLTTDSVDSTDGDQRKVFDFLVNGILLRVTLEEFLSEHGLSREDVLHIECILKAQAPTPQPSLAHDDWVSGVRATDKFVFTACYDCKVHIWSIFDQKHRLDVSGHSAPVKCLTILGKTPGALVRFATGSQDQNIMVWNFDSKSKRAHCSQVGRGHERSVECLCSNEDGTRVASGSFDNYVKIWNTDESASEQHNESEEVGTAKKKFKSGKEDNKSITKTPMVTLAGHREVVSGVCWSDVAEIMTCSWDKSIISWDLQSAAQKSSFASSAAFTSIAYSNLNNLIVTGSTDPYVRLWDPRNTAITAAKSVYSSHSGWVVGLDWSKTNEYHFVSASYDKLLKIWDTRSLKAPLFDLAGQDDRCLCCDWSNSAYVMSGGVDCSVKLYSMPSSC